MAGVIGIRTREYEKSSTSGELDYGSYGTLRAHVSHGSRIKRFSYAAGLGQFQTRGPDAKHAAERVSNLFLKAKWQPSDRLTIQASERMSTEIQASFADRKPTYESFDTQTGKTTRNTEADREWNFHAIQAVAPARSNTNRYGAFGVGGSAKGFDKVTAVVDEWQRPVLTGTLGAAVALGPLSILDVHAAFGKVKPRPGSLSVDLTEPEDETQVKIDLGINRNFITFGQASAVVFATRQGNALVLSGKTAVLDGRVLELYLNRDQVQIGCEAAWRAPVLWDRIQPFANAAYLYSVADESGAMVRNREYPSWIANGGVYGKWRSVDLNVLAKYVSRFQSIRFAVPSATVYHALGNFLVFDAIAGWNMGFSPNIRIVLEISNLTDQRYSTVVGYPDFGRKYSVGIRRAW